MTKREIAHNIRQELHGRSDSFKDGLRLWIFLVFSGGSVTGVYYYNEESLFAAIVAAFICVAIWNSYKNKVKNSTLVHENRLLTELLLTSNTKIERLAPMPESKEEKEIPFEIEMYNDPPELGDNDRFEVDIQRNIKKPAPIGFTMNKTQPKGLKRRLPESYADWVKKINADRGGASLSQTRKNTY